MEFQLYKNNEALSCAAWGTVKDFLSTNKEEVVTSLKKFVQSGLRFEVGHEQIISWEDCYDFLKQQFFDLIKIKPDYKKLYIAFEYYLPLEGGRRPDVILFSDEKVIIFEFKRKSDYQYSDIEQTIAYKRDIENYHYQTYEDNWDVLSYLVLTKGSTDYQPVDGISILNKSNFKQQIKNINLKAADEDKVFDWLKSHYRPLPSIIDATLDLFKNGELPQIKNIEEGQIADTVNYLKRLIHVNEIRKQEKNLVLVSGVPGSGKTLAALKVLYDYNEYKLKEYKELLSAIYLSGNGPLVNVLQSMLSKNIGELGKTGKSYVKSVRQYKQQYKGNNCPIENVIIFDEAQRAWDKEKEKGNESEAEIFLKIAEKIYNRQGNVTIIAFIGDGQSIHTGEEKGIELWKEALKKFSDWNLYCPPKYKEVFSDINNLNSNSKLNLDHSIRNHFIDISDWIEAILDGDFNRAQQNLKKMQEKGFVLRITREFKKAKKFVKESGKEDDSITYGLLISSKAEDEQVRKQLDNKYYGSYMKGNEVGNWFMGDNKEFKKAASEFACQGLELDFPIVCFGGDYYFNGDEWVIKNKVWEKNNNKYKDFVQIMQNIYRVLLSRGREGMILYLPEFEILDKTYSALVKSGVRKL